MQAFKQLFFKKICKIKLIKNLEIREKCVFLIIESVKIKQK